jgi:SMODS and SLOG-associating 2TM effector domain 2
MQHSQSSLGRNASGDLVSQALPEFAKDASLLDIANGLFRWVEASALTVCEWYLHEKEPKARRSRLLRLLAIILATTGSVAPFIAVGTGDSTYVYLGYPMLAAAAAAVGADRALGLSSSWMRYQISAAAIGKLVLQRQLQWAVVSRELIDSPTSDVAFREAMSEIHGFAGDLCDLVVGETQNWVEDFRGYFARLESAAERFGP